MSKLLLIAAGGALGTLLRYGLSGLTYRYLEETFPWGTLAVNVIGCFVIGFLWSTSERTPFSPEAGVFIFTGVLGAFTTFSTFGLESFNLLRDGDIGPALVNILASNLLALLAVFLGFIAARFLLHLTGPGGAS